MLDRAEKRELQDHELLEVLLFNPIPRKNTNEIAHRLLATFGSLKNVLSADRTELMRVEGVGAHTAQYLESVFELVNRVGTEYAPAPEAFNFSNFSAVVAERFRDLSVEVVDIFCLEKNDRIKHTARLTSEERGRVEVAVDAVGRVLLDHTPYAVVVAHNHPHAPCCPSLEDDRFTAQLQLLCSINKVKLRDHIIVGEDGMYSYFAYGRLEEMEHRYSVENIIGSKSIP